jgi:hypothetical protein
VREVKSGSCNESAFPTGVKSLCVKCQHVVDIECSSSAGHDVSPKPFCDNAK